MYPYNAKMGQKIQTNAPGVSCDQWFGAHLIWDAPAAGDTDVLLNDKATSSTLTTVVTVFLAQPDYARQIIITPGGTTADVAAGNIVVVGTDISGKAITENVAIAANATGGVLTTKAFKSLTSITFPIQDGAAATYDVGTTDKLGLPYALPHNTVRAAYLNNVLEGTVPTVTTSTADYALNFIDLNSVLNGTKVDAYLMV